jgi:DNA-binding sugar fermentation-stimulating protein
LRAPAAFAPAAHCDPAYAAGLAEARAAGVKLVCAVCRPTEDGAFEFVGTVPVCL